MADATRIFSGLIYRRWNHAATKAKAQKLAKKYRKQGYLVRVVENDKSWRGSDNAWGIFCRMKVK